MAKVGITIDDDLLAKVDLYADEMFTSRSGLITHSLTQWIFMHESTTALCRLASAMEKIAEQGEITPEALNELKDLERLVRHIKV